MLYTFFAALRFYPFWAIPAIFIFVEICFYAFSKQKWVFLALSIFSLLILTAGLVLFFIKGGFVPYLPALKQEIEMILGA